MEWYVYIDEPVGDDEDIQEILVFDIHVVNKVHVDGAHLDGTDDNHVCTCLLDVYLIDWRFNYLVYQVC